MHCMKSIRYPRYRRIYAALGALFFPLPSYGIEQGRFVIGGLEAISCISVPLFPDFRSWYFDGIEFRTLHYRLVDIRVG